MSRTTLWQRKERYSGSNNFFLAKPIFSTRSKIGILGGIGPEATAHFYTLLIRKLQRKGLIKCNMDFPQIIVNSIPAPELIRAEVSGKELRPYVKGLRELDEFGVDFIVMVCNTIHLFHNRLQKRMKTPILDLKEEVRKFLMLKDIKSVLVLGTPLTVRKGLYEFENIATYKPDEREMKQLVEVIFNFNKEGKTYPAKVKTLCDKYLGKGAETVILGCTELALILDRQVPAIDTIDVLAEATIARLNEKRIQKSDPMY
ncbi:MAG: aspartate/glutamate racemase family protein [Candidatus Aenigmarchaeota archaeon]|nr:aspartate/glutamate racemase family protein [Candidatus Aenigmarchaeota archaeon]